MLFMLLGVFVLLYYTGMMRSVYGFIFGLVFFLSACRFDTGGLSVSGSGDGGVDASIYDDGGKEHEEGGIGEGGVLDEGGIIESCGDGVLDPGEECDEGEENSDFFADACRTDCRLAHCGDGVEDSGEECDYGDLNSDVEPNMCRTDCRLPYCGDGVVDNLEECDDGGANSDVNPGACRTDCTMAACGDGVTDPGEECDHGDQNSNDLPNACREDCRLPYCGDGVVDDGEECDDGNMNDGDGCSSTCVFFPKPVLDSAWECFEEDIGSCDGISCSTSDSVDTCKGQETEGCLDATCVHIYSGNTGYCGIGGVHQIVTVPDAPGVVLYAKYKTECDTHAGDAALAVNEGGARTDLVLIKREDVDWEERVADMTPWAGQDIRLEVIIRGLSDKWCNASDQSVRIKVDFLEFRQQ